jgi:hypothetical protein
MKWPYKEIFDKYKADCKVFFETGTHYGDSVEDALDLGYEKIYSVEIDEKLFEFCCKKFKKYLGKRVFLWNGDSVDLMPIMLEKLNEKALFWLDAHKHENAPIQNELKILKNHYIKEHVIIIDDIGVPGHDTNEDILKKLILDINPNYQFLEEYCANKQLIAFT